MDLAARAISHPAVPWRRIVVLAPRRSNKTKEAQRIRKAHPDLLVLDDLDQATLKGLMPTFSKEQRILIVCTPLDGQDEAYFTGLGFDIVINASLTVQEHTTFVEKCMSNVNFVDQNRYLVGLEDHVRGNTLENTVLAMLDWMEQDTMERKLVDTLRLVCGGYGYVRLLENPSRGITWQEMPHTAKIISELASAYRQRASQQEDKPILCIGKVTKDKVYYYWD